MSIAKKALATAVTAALASSIACIAPAASVAQPAPFAAAGSAYSTMAKAKFKTKYATLLPGEKTTLKVKGAKVKSWSSSKKSVASVSKKGVVTAKKAGKATITAKTAKGNAKFVISVDDPAGRTLIDLENIVTLRGTEQPAEDPLQDDETEFVLPVSADGKLCVVYEVDYEGFRFVDAGHDGDGDNAYEFRIIMDLDPSGDLASFVFYVGDNMYSAPVKPSSYAASTKLKWTGYDASRKDIDVSEEEQEALTELALGEFYTIGKAINSETGIQMRNLGFYKVNLFK